MANNNAKAPAAPQQSNAALQAQVEKLTQDNAAVLQVANIAAQQLLYIESRFSPLLSKKINVWNALFHIKEIILLVKEIIKMIQDFRAKFMPQPTNDTPQ